MRVLWSHTHAPITEKNHCNSLDKSVTVCRVINFKLWVFPRINGCSFLSTLHTVKIQHCSNKSSEVAEMGDHGHNRHGPKIASRCALSLGAAGSPSNTMSSGPRPTSMQSGTLVHPAIWPQLTCAKSWGCAPFGQGDMSPYLTQCCLGRGLPLYKWYRDANSHWATTDMG